MSTDREVPMNTTTEISVAHSERGAGNHQDTKHPNARQLRKYRQTLDAAPWRGPERRYDILKEATVAFAIVLVLTFVLAILFSSPDVPPVTIKAWADAQPKGFTEIALSELKGTSNSATYGPPYNNENGSVQYLGPISIQKLLGVHYPINTAQDFVLDPLETLPGERPLKAALLSYQKASVAQRHAWETTYGNALAHANVHKGALVVPSGSYGPLGKMFTNLLTMAQSGALDSQLVTHSSFYTTDYTKPILFIGDSWKAQHTASYWGKMVVSQHLRSSQWGVMNETGSWPGQPWLWFYTMLYQIPPMSTTQTANADILAIAIVSVFTLALLLLPFIPGLRDIPRKIPIHRLIWRDYYRDMKNRASTGTGSAQSKAAPAHAFDDHTAGGSELSSN